MPFDAAERRVLLLAGLAAFFAAYGGSVLFFALPAVAHDFHARIQALANLGSLLALGAVLGLPLAALADRAGRSRVMALGVLAFSIADLLSAAASDLGQLTLTRFAAVCFEDLVLSLAAVMAVEEVGAEKRALATAAVALAAGLGTGLTTLLYPLAAPDWRLVYLPAGFGIPVAWLLWKWLPEGRTWLQAKRRRWALGALSEAPFRNRMAVLAAASLLAAILYEPVGLFAAFFGSRFLHLSPGAISAVAIASGVVAGAGFLGGGWLSDRAGRRRLGVLLSLLTAATTAAIFAGGLGGYLAGSVTSGLAAGALSPLFTAWLGELLPTRGRATGETLTVVAAAAGGALGLQLFGILEPALNFTGAILLASSAAVIGSLFLLLLPETRAAPLPD